jgi:hypothetical protein
MTTRGLLLLIITVAACGGASSTATAPADVEAPDRCAADPAVAATRMPRPAGTGCMSQASLDALDQACQGGDAAACDRAVGCRLSLDLDPAKAPGLRLMLRTACDGGIAESCRLRVGVVTETGGALPDDACADLIRGCQLGDDLSCYDCRNTCR